MSYIRFWLRCCIVFIPGCFIVLYAGAHQSLAVSAIWSLAIPVCGLLMMSPLILSFGKVDRGLWSRQAEYERRQRRLDYLEKLRQEEQGEE
ncbi:MAG: hypothetical protein JWN30_642 [Bacilli bacterium]|nr:hypothetical protein [Bacilli bacterium]